MCALSISGFVHEMYHPSCHSVNIAMTFIDESNKFVNISYEN